ncbi:MULTISPECIES: DUF423 domain-containing protein [unclassified Devosia]|uniref:DUF423 domain-containing protein n=1 Tax=unclassified Devosia TaxID=196773 RepID=UPI0020C1119E|nr:MULTISPECIES: DUF423 domain-containing protein [unclassified Devosia]
MTMVQGGVLARLLLAGAGVVGAIGVAAAAGASHAGGSRNIEAIAAVCLAHGPALLALGLAGRGRILGAAGALLAMGTGLFVLDLGVREWLGQGAFPGAAPMGGMGMIGGWVAISLAALARRAPEEKI